MAFKCEICKARDAKRQFIGSILNGMPEEELYICNECYEKLTPSLTWKSLGPILTLQHEMLGKSLPLKNAVGAVMAESALKIHEKITSELLKYIPEFYKDEMTMIITITDMTRSGKKRGQAVHTLSFAEPYFNESNTIEVFPYEFDGDLVNVYLSLDPGNDRNLLNVMMPKMKEYCSPGFNYIGVGLDYGPFDVVQFFDCLVHAVDMLGKFCNQKSADIARKSCDGSRKSIEEILEECFPEEFDKPKRKTGDNGGRSSKKAASAKKSDNSSKDGGSGKKSTTKKRTSKNSKKPPKKQKDE